MCFNVIEWDDQKVSEKMTIMLSSTSLKEDEMDEEVKAATIYLYRCMKRLLNAPPVMDALQEDIRDMIDTTYRKHLGGEDMWKKFGTNDTEWREGYAQYTNEVLGSLSKIVEQNLESEEHRDTPDDVKRAWKACVSKATLVLKIKGPPDYPEWFPFMSISVWRDMSEQLKRVPKALTEVSHICSVKYVFHCTPYTLRAHGDHMPVTHTECTT